MTTQPDIEEVVVSTLDGLGITYELVKIKPEFADTALDHGITPPAAATRAEFANQVGSLPSRVLAAVVDRSTFAPETAEPEDAEHVWSAVDELRASLDQSTTRWGRIKARISVRSLGAVRWLERRAGKETGS